MARDERKVFDDERFLLQATRLGVVRIDAIIPDRWGDRSNDLATVRRVGEDFLIGGKTRLEDDLPSGLPKRPERHALENTSGFEYESGVRVGPSPKRDSSPARAGVLGFL